MMKVVIAGDFCDNGRTRPLIEEGNFEEMFAEVKPIVEVADYSLVNFEFPIVEGAPTPIEKRGPCLKGQKKAIDAIKYAGFKCATLANNHILDHGEANCLNTKALLESARVDTVGAGKNAKDASKVLYINIKGETLAVINCCEHEFSIATETTAGANALNPVQQYYAIKEAREKADYVLVVVHGGHEHFQLPSPRMKETYRFFIDAGADAVVNHHQHCYSGYEVYNGKPIFYGIGNFCFDSENKRDSIWNEGFLLTLNFASGSTAFELCPYVQCNESPSVVPMLGERREAFYEEISKLNQIIADDALLRESHIRWMDQSISDIKMLFSPFSFRLFRSLVSRQLLPPLLSRKKQIEMLAFLQCESHICRLLHVLKNR